MINWFTESSSQPQPANCGIRIQTGYKNRARRPPRAHTLPRSSPAPPGHYWPKASKVCKSIEDIEDTSYDVALGDTKSLKCVGFYCKIDNVLFEVGIAIVDC